MVPLVARGRLHVDGDRRADPGADARHRRSRATAAARSSSRSGCTRRTVVRAGGAQVACAVPRSRAVGSDRLHLRGLGRRRGGRRLRRPAGRGGPAVRRAHRRGRGASSRSSWTARTPGSTSRAAAGRSSGRSIGRLSDHPELRTVTMAEACREPRRDADRHLSRARGSTRTSTSGSATPTTSGPGASWPRRATRSTTRRPASTRRRWREAREEILIAEGSDWFWWYGDDHSSAHDLEFDDLFRRHLRNVYRLLQTAGARRAVRQQHLDRRRRRRSRPSRRRC